ncbi:MAG: hypothetical protein A3C30_02905 [Candidatus Levybacteria bacterium RIFCSPHIGHO2_02_FULL_40_18]|nr:MAG: hypothetical protein A2869_05075 [Candidatus Levybacteria bacterium RIFCSPHIGHO2_01_FULL_40_58]OGH26924.1 MAG: hypothetical protein A3C30_02905 [Candidatus Levybacteria bacterium RIFCSPHIGHO2_02_FULL_40_18]OGH32046.1 MAG: hypothetical protein A3E43_03885 [Candidatus Levybacteria bacterium RIFCSPHIGHO2_12_FULL_40_31]OGH40832.1 MAG: hypothetical protein A2894_04515 [Candidatus Levybacteria bacterium RIFCSPLOWO2_01_FULL_40_64]OGH48688.1 MAG: hypothetical protein A3I54_03445 [Candidatus Lev
MTSILLSKARRRLAAKDPHNVFASTFAETGFLGLGSLVLLLLYFLQKDIGIMKSSNDLSKTFVVSFWTLFVFALLNPSSSIIYQTLFWLLRALIEKSPKLRSRDSFNLTDNVVVEDKGGG